MQATSGSGNSAEQGGIAEGGDGGEAQDLTAFEVADGFAAGGVEIAMEQLQAVDLAIGATGGEKGLPFGVGGGADHTDVDAVGSGERIGGEDEQGKGQMV